MDLKTLPRFHSPTHRSVAIGVALAAALALSTVLAGPSVQRVSQRKADVEIAIGDQTLILRPLADNAIRVRVTDGKTPESPSLVLTEKIPVLGFHVQETTQAIVVSTAKMKAHVNRTTGALSFSDGNGKVFLAEKTNGRSLKPAAIQDEPTLAVEDAFISPPDERLFGSGQFQDGELNLQDLPRRLTQVNCQISIPFFLSSKGYGLLWHNYGLTELNPADGKIELSAHDPAGSATEVEVTTTQGTKKETRRFGEFTGTFTAAESGRYAFLLDVGRKMGRRWHVEVDGKTAVDFSNYWLPPTTSWHLELTAGTHSITVIGEEKDEPVVWFRRSENLTVLRSPVADALDYVVFVGNADEVIGTYRTLSGPAPLLPQWAYGYIHCRERYKSQQEILDSAAEFRRRNLPMDVIVQDWRYWGKYGWNAMRFDEADYPDPAAMVQKLHALNTRLMVSVWSRIDPKSEVGREFADGHLFIPETDWVDFFNPTAAAKYWTNFSQRMLSLGIDAWWQDATEPENDDLVGRRTFLGPGEKLRNIYPLFVTRTVYEGQRKDAPGQRVFILTRSAFPGEQRYAAATWSGDIGNDWETLRRQIPAGLNFMASGFPYWTTDAGGFFRPGEGQYSDPGYHERFVRWFQFATFCPLQRVHGYQTDTEFWRYGSDVEQQARRYLDFRHQLFPYIYSEAARVTFAGSTLMRPLVMDFAGDPTALDQKHEFMFGPAFLVSPVLESGVSQWSTYLPQNEGGWVDFWTGEHRSGGQTAVCNAPLSQIPLHVRAGSIVPLGPKEQYVGEKPADPLELRIYAGANGTFQLYEDEGVNTNYEHGAHAVIPVTWNDRTKTLTLGKREGTFPGVLRERSFRIVLVRPGRGVGIEPSEQVDAVVHYSGKRVKTAL